MPEFLPADLAKWSGGEWLSGEPNSINGVTKDTRTMKRGNLYFALKGERFDGHDFVETAFEKGASGVVVAASYVRAAKNKGLRADRDALLLVNDTGKALLDIACAYRKKINPTIIAITGSAGKSTVKEMTAQVLSSCMPVAYTRGNWNNEIGLPMSILDMEPSCRIGVFEIGMNHAGEIDRLCDVLNPSWGLITNIGRAHIEFFGTEEAIAKEKGCLLKRLPGEGMAVLNRDDRFFSMFRSECRCRVVTVSMEQDADYRCVKREYDGNKVCILEKTSGDEVCLDIPVPGIHNVINAMFAVAIARSASVNWDKIKESIKNYKSLPMRWEKKIINKIVVINDAYNSNPLSMRSAIQAFSEVGGKSKKWLVLGGMLELGDVAIREHEELGRFVAGRNIAGLIAIGDLGEIIAQGARDGGFKGDKVFHCANNHEAVLRIIEKIDANDEVLLKGSRGMHMEEIVQEMERRSRQG